MVVRIKLQVIQMIKPSLFAFRPKLYLGLEQYRNQSLCNILKPTQPHPTPKQQLVEVSRKVFGSVLTSTISAISAVDLFAVTQIAGFLHFEFTL